MGGKKIEIKRIISKEKRYVTFSKRRQGLFKMLKDTASKYGVEIACIVFIDFHCCDYRKGYWDPEYYMTQKLTQKSNVYSFGVVMFELLTARTPLGGKYIVRDVKAMIYRRRDLCNCGLHELLHPTLGLGIRFRVFEEFVDLAMRCVEESGANRPTMCEVVKEIESIMQLAGLNPNAEYGFTSAIYEGTSTNSDHSCNNEASLDYSGVRAHLPE